MHPCRTQTRIPVRLTVLVSHGETTWRTQSKDISAGGILLESDGKHEVAVGAMVQVQVESASQPPIATAQVVRVTPSEIALSFATEAPSSP